MKPLYLSPKTIVMATFHGLQIYEILENGNLLIGPFINTPKDLSAQPPYEIDSEIARKRVFDDKGVGGVYECRYIETTPGPLVVTHCTLEITKQNEVYEFVWSENNIPIFKGISMKVGNDHIAVTYSNP